MNFNWSKTKNVNVLFSTDLKNDGLLKKSDIAQSWEVYLSIFDDNKCLKSQKVTEHSLLKFSKHEAATYTPDSSIIIEFANTDFSLEGIVKFAEKYGRLGMDNSFDFSESYIELANTWLWELANVRNVLSLITHKQNLSVEKFSKLLKIDLGTGLWEFENNRFKTADINFPVYIIPTGNFELGFNKELIRFKENLNNNNLPQAIDDILSVIFFNFYRDRVKPVISSEENKFTSEVQPVSLIGYIWHELFKIVENNNIIKNCRYCKEVFTIGAGSARSDKVYCSNSCVVNGSRTEGIFKKHENDFKKNGYIIRKSSGNTDKQFDYWLINKDNQLIAGLDIAQSEISEFSQKWDNQCKIIQSKLKANDLAFSFLINKTGRKYLFSTFSPSGKFIEIIPQISKFNELLDKSSKYNQLRKEQEKLNEQLKKIKETKEKFKKVKVSSDFFRDMAVEDDLTILTFDDDKKNKKEVA
jgi:hypothetical protein